MEDESDYEFKERRVTSRRASDFDKLKFGVKDISWLLGAIMFLGGGFLTFRHEIDGLNAENTLKRELLNAQVQSLGQSYLKLDDKVALIGQKINEIEASTLKVYNAIVAHSKER